MSQEISIRKGFTQVDRQDDPAMLVAGMDATAQWPAVQRLRSWERDRLKIESGDTVLDVGCGPGEVVVDLAAFVEPDGRAVGVDASENMLAAAAARAKRQKVSVEFVHGDAAALKFDDETFTAVRSERTLQWLEDPAKAVAEMHRVLRPGGRICLIDTDWRTLLPDHPSPDVARRFLDAMGAIRGDQISVGGRLVNLLRDAGVAEIDATAETHMWLEWNPDDSVAPAGMVPMRFVAKDLVGQGLLDAADADQMIDEFEQSAREGRFFVSLTMFAAAGVKPD